MSRIPSLRVALIGAATLVVFAVAVYWAATIQRGINGSVRSRAEPAPAEVGQREIGAVFQPLFGVSIAAEKARTAKARLETLEWNDATHQSARVPIRRAMEILVDQDQKRRRSRP